MASPLSSERIVITSTNMSHDMQLDALYAVSSALDKNNTYDRIATATAANFTQLHSDKRWVCRVFMNTTPWPAVTDTLQWEQLIFASPP